MRLYKSTFRAGEPGRRRLFVAMLVVGGVWLILACTPVTRWRDIGRSTGQPVATGTAGHENSRLVSEAYAAVKTLPGYRLEIQYAAADARGRRLEYELSGVYDAAGNSHLLLRTADGQEKEFYVVAGHSYVYESRYQGWLDLGAVAPLEFERRQGALPADFRAIEAPGYLPARFGAAPARPAADDLNGRAATRYTLRPVGKNDNARLPQQPAGAPLDLNGFVWIDRETGVLLKTEITLYDRKTGRSLQEYRLEITEIGRIASLTAPAPVIDPAASRAATATAQVWTVLAGQMNYRGTPVAFEVIPLQAIQVPGSSPLRAEVEMIVRQLPEPVWQEAALPPFLAQLRQQLRLSIPERNFVVTSSGFRLENSRLQDRTARVIYTFNADLEDFEGVELILAGTGNPVFGPVPVE